ncbi:MAG: hypothetical protein O3C40_31695 [Planctomycetota bacterium]|nr:hypothetical protein [Planctomycetota bacterium]
MFHRLAYGGVAVVLIHKRLPPIVRAPRGNFSQADILAEEIHKLVARVSPIANGVRLGIASAGDV